MIGGFIVLALACIGAARVVTVGMRHARRMLVRLGYVLLRLERGVQ